MKIIITGSLGHISKPLPKPLIEKGYAVTVISSNPEKEKDIEAIGATAAIGSIEDIHFLAKHLQMPTLFTRCCRHLNLKKIPILMPGKKREGLPPIMLQPFKNRA